MKIYFLSLGAGLLVGIVYSILGVRSPAPPVVALVGLFGILLGEQALPIAKRLIAERPVAAFIKTDCADHVLGQLPSNADCSEDRP